MYAAREPAAIRFVTFQSDWLAHPRSALKALVPRLAQLTAHGTDHMMPADGVQRLAYCLSDVGRLSPRRIEQMVGGDIALAEAPVA